MILPRMVITVISIRHLTFFIREAYRDRILIQFKMDTFLFCHASYNCGVPILFSQQLDIPALTTSKIRTHKNWRNTQLQLKKLRICVILNSEDLFELRVKEKHAPLIMMVLRS